MARSQSRRTFLKTVGVAGAAGVGLHSVDGTALDPVGDAEALPCGGLCVGAAAVAAGGAVAGWLLRDKEVIGKDDPAQGLTADGLKNQVWNTAQTRKSTNKSTFVDNKNIMEMGLPNTLYSEGKLAAIKALNDQKSESEVQTAALDAMESHMVTVQQNFLRSWNESVAEARSLYTAMQDHSDLTAANVMTVRNSDWEPSPPDNTLTLADGTTSITLSTVSRDGSNPYEYDPTQRYSGNNPAIEVSYDGQTLNYLIFDEWNAIWSQLQTIKSNVNDGLVTWVSNVYSQVQSGEIDTSDLMTSSELAALDSGDSTVANQAIRDLMALNIPANLEREAEINIPSTGTTLYGRLAMSGSGTLEAGTTVDPTADSKDYYLTYDASQAHGTWDAYESGVDGGTVTFTSDPHPGVIWTIKTTADESAEVATSDFSDNGDGTYSVDISGQVETAITNVSSVKFYSDSEEAQMQTVMLDETFKIVSFTDSEGNTHDTAEYDQPSKPQDDTNYITQDQWEQREKEYKDLIDKYEASSGGAGGLLDGIGGGNSKLVVVAAAAAGAIGLLK